MSGSTLAEELLSIGDVASRTGVTVATVRYYDEIGLVSAPERVGGKRRFRHEAIGRINFIRRAQDSSFSLEEIREILDEREGGWRRVVDGKLAELEGRRSDLDAMIAILSEIRDCGCEVVASCERAGGPELWIRMGASASAVQS
jgi:MerR family redox-sensitive transcriptional activator SoxR